MSRKLEHELEMRIARKAVESLLANHYKIEINDGGDENLTPPEQTADAIMAMLCTTGEDYLVVTRADYSGWVRLIWGNIADVISDYTLSLEDVLKPANDLAKEYLD